MTTHFLNSLTTLVWEALQDVLRVEDGTSSYDVLGSGRCGDAMNDRSFFRENAVSLAAFLVGVAALGVVIAMYSSMRDCTNNVTVLNVRVDDAMLRMDAQQARQHLDTDAMKRDINAIAVMVATMQQDLQDSTVSSSPSASSSPPSTVTSPPSTVSSPPSTVSSPPSTVSSPPSAAVAISPRRHRVR
jgi:hypothetical protein